MIGFLPRSDPGAATEYLRPNGCGVSTESGALLCAHAHAPLRHGGQHDAPPPLRARAPQWVHEPRGMRPPKERGARTGAPGVVSRRFSITAVRPRATALLCSTDKEAER